MGVSLYHCADSSRVKVTDRSRNQTSCNGVNRGTQGNKLTEEVEQSNRHHAPVESPKEALSEPNGVAS